MAAITQGTVTGDLDTSALHQDHADIRREGAIHTADVRREVATEACKTIDAVKTAGWHNSDRTGNEADRLSNQATQFYISAQKDAHDTATALAALKSQVDMQFAAQQSALQLTAEKIGAANALASANTNMLVVQEAVKGRELAVLLDRENLRHQLYRAEARAARCEPVCFIRGTSCGNGNGNGNGNGDD